MKQYIAAHRSDYNLEEVQDLIEATNIIRHYSPQTYWEPGEDAVEFDVEYDKKFSEIVKVIEFDFFGDEEGGLIVLMSKLVGKNYLSHWAGFSLRMSLVKHMKMIRKQ